MNLKDISEPIQSEFQQVKQVLRQEISSQYERLGKVAGHLVEMRGKMMRPMLTLLTAKLMGDPTQRSINVAATLEMIHNATLIHDDVIDEAYYRHGKLTLGALLRSRSAVIVGDFLFSKGLIIASKVKAYQEIDIVIEAIEAVVEGELRQAHNVETLQVDKEEYFRVINLKTSALIAAAAKAGAVSVGANEEMQQLAYSFGESIGSAFQIQDDILDYAGSAKTGKAIFNDIKERKITLPLIMAMEQGGTGILSSLKRGNVSKVSAFVEQYNGIELAAKECDRIIDEAVKMLDRFEDSATKKSLIQIAYFAGNRSV